MEYRDFIGAVQNRARVGTEEQALSAIRATLETLGERIVTGEAEDLAAQLPREIGYYLRQHADNNERFDLDEFYERVTRRESMAVDLPDAVHHARVVMSVLEEATTPGEMADVRAQLPDEFDDLFEFEEIEPLTG